jgi:hypothetical protein
MTDWISSSAQYLVPHHHDMRSTAASARTG